MKKIFTISLLGIFLTACQTEQTADQIIDQAIEKAGGNALENSAISFDFREHHYVVIRKQDDWEMQRIKSDSVNIADHYRPNSFIRSENGIEIAVEDSMVAKYRESINSVVYFALLPYKLDDPAVISHRLEDENIEGKNYFKVHVKFKEEGGGEDFQDVFVYWFDQEDYSLDYLAYSFQVNEGGLRFRKAYNERIVEGIRFVDYINYKGPKDAELKDLAKMYEEGELKELSKIELEEVKVKLITN